MTRVNNLVSFLDYLKNTYPVSPILEKLKLMVEIKLVCETEVEIHGWDSLWWTRVAREDFLKKKSCNLAWLRGERWFLSMVGHLNM